jgi:hypothetical protein
MKPIQHLVWVGGRRHLDGRTDGRSRYVASTSATARLGTRTYLLDVAVNRRRQRWRIDERCRPSPLLDVLALNVGKDRVQRTSEKFACRLDARSCGIKKVGRRYLVAGSLIRKSKRVRSGQLGPHRSLVSTAFLDERKCLGLRSPCGRSLPLPFSLVNALAEEETKALAKGSSFPLVSLIGDGLCLHGSLLSTVLHRLQRTRAAFLLVLHADKCGLMLLSPQGLASELGKEASAAEPQEDDSGGLHLPCLSGA